MLVCLLCRLAAPWGAFDETLFDEIWLVNVLNCAGIFAHRCRNRIQSYWSAAELVNDGGQQFVVYLVKTERVYVERFQGILRNIQIYLPVAFHLRKVAHAAEQRIRYTGRPSAAARYLACRFLVDLDA